MRSTRWSFIGTLLLLMVWPHAYSDDSSCSSPAATANDNAKFAAYFSHHPQGAVDCTLEDILINVLDKAPSGSSVHGAFYTFTRHRVKDAFIDAHQRGVDVRLVIDDRNEVKGYAAALELKSELGDRVTVCVDSCIGTKINHNKFLLLSRLDNGDENIVVQTSFNPTATQLKKNNDMVVIRGDVDLYQAYANYWSDLQTQERNDNYNESSNGSVGGSLNTHVDFFPKKEGSVLHDTLASVECSAGSVIYIANKRLTVSYDGETDLVNQLVQMVDEGCEIHAIYNVMNSTALRDRLTAGDVKLAMCSTLSQCSGLHSKYLLIDGIIDGQNRKFVLNGTHNHTEPALRNNDETLLRIENDQIFDRYLENWSYMRHEHSPYNLVEAFTTGVHGTLYIYPLGTSINPANCVRNNRYTLSINDPAYNEIAVMIKRAWKSGIPIRFQIDGTTCNGESPRIRNARARF